MLTRVATLAVILIVAGQALAGGIACGIDAISNLNNPDEMACPMQNQGDCEEKGCCAQGKSPTGSVVAMVCCEVFCGESTGGAQFNFTPLTLVFAPLVVSYRTAESNLLSPDTDPAFSVFLRSAENILLSHAPPDLFLFNSTFLI